MTPEMIIRNAVSKINLRYIEAFNNGNINEAELQRSQNALYAAKTIEELVEAESDHYERFLDRSLERMIAAGAPEAAAKSVIQAMRAGVSLEDIKAIKL